MSKLNNQTPNLQNESNFFKYYPIKCIEEQTEEEIRNEFSNFPEDFYLVEKFFSDPEILKLKEKAIFFNACRYQTAMSFIMYGYFENYNNVIGLIDRTDSFATNSKLLLDKKYILPIGGIGFCSLIGLIEGNLLYGCGGAEGPGGAYTIYLMNKTTGKSKIIKDCTSWEGKEDCKVNTLNI